MLSLLTQYSIAEIIIFIIILAIAVKELINFIDWVKEKMHGYVKESKEKDNAEKTIQEEIQKITETQQEIQKNLLVLSEAVQHLTESDRDDIKAFITREHHYFQAQGWIDDYSLECIERRFVHYKREGGNSFIEGFMNEIRALPHQPPKK